MRSAIPAATADRDTAIEPCRRFEARGDIVGRRKRERAALSEAPSHQLSPPTHIVRVEKRRRLVSETLAPEPLAKLEQALHAGPWYADRWSRREFRRAAIDVLRSAAPNGLVLIHHTTSVEAPPPFEHFFEPIELGANERQMRTLSGEADTREERISRWGVAVGLLLVPALVIPLLMLLFQRGLVRQMLIVILVLAGVAGFIVVAVNLRNFFERWFLVPGGVVIWRRSNDPQRRVRLLRRADYVAVIRVVQAGQVPVRMLELMTPDGKFHRRSVSDRDAASFLAAWQSSHPPPTHEQLVQALP